MAAASIKEPAGGTWQNGVFVPSPATPGLPAYGNIPGVADLFSPNFGRQEVLTRGAENAIAGGFGMGGFAQNQSARLLDSERKANFIAGHQILEPYLQRDFQGAQNAAERQARMDQIAAEGAQALQRLQLSEAGQGQRLTQQEEAEARRQVVAGQQAMQQLTLREAGDTSRQRTQIQGQLANTLLSGAMSGKGGTSGGLPQYQDTSTTDVSRGYGTGPSAWGTPDSSVPHWGDPNYARANAGGIGLGSSSIDSLLRKYNLI